MDYFAHAQTVSASPWREEPRDSITSSACKLKCHDIVILITTVTILVSCFATARSLSTSSQSLSTSSCSSCFLPNSSCQVPTLRTPLCVKVHSSSPPTGAIFPWEYCSYSTSSWGFFASVKSGAWLQQ